MKNKTGHCCGYWLGLPVGDKFLLFNGTKTFTFDIL